MKNKKVFKKANQDGDFFTVIYKGQIQPLI
jgi:hypothetical protein